MIPPPTLCPDCRQQRRLSFRNERTLYKRTCDATGRDIVSIYSPISRYHVFHTDEWYIYDFVNHSINLENKSSFFDTFNALLENIPHM